MLDDLEGGDDDLDDLLDELDGVGVGKESVLTKATPVRNQVKGIQLDGEAT